MKAPDLDRLNEVLDEWQPQPSLSEEFTARLQQNLQERRHRLRAWWSAGAVATVAALLAGFIYLGSLRPAPSARTVEQIAVVEDLQLLSNHAEVIEHLNFLTLPPEQNAAAEDRN